MKDFCRKCGRAGWASEAAAYGHEGRCKGIPGLLARTSNIQASSVMPSSKASLKGTLEAPAEGAQGPQSLPFAPSPPVSEDPHPRTGYPLLEGRLAILEDEHKLIKEIVTNDLQHLGQVASEVPSPLPWIVLGGVLVLGGLWIFGVFEGVGSQEDDVNLGIGGLRSRFQPHVAGNGFVSRVVDKVAGKVIDKALSRIF